MFTCITMRSFSILYFSFHSLDDTIARVDLARRRRKLEHFCVCSFFYIVLCNTLSLCVAAVLFPLPVTTRFFFLSLVYLLLSFLFEVKAKELLLVVAVKSVTTSILTNTTLLFSFYLFFNYVFKSCVLWSWSDHIFTPHQYKQCISLLLWNNV